MLTILMVQGSFGLKMSWGWTIRILSSRRVKRSRRRARAPWSPAKTRSTAARAMYRGFGFSARPAQRNTVLTVGVCSLSLLATSSEKRRLARSTTKPTVRAGALSNESRHHLTISRAPRPCSCRWNSRSRDPTQGARSVQRPSWVVDARSRHSRFRSRYLVLRPWPSSRATRDRAQSGMLAFLDGGRRAKTMSRCSAPESSAVAETAASSQRRHRKSGGISRRPLIMSHTCLLRPFQTSAMLSQRRSPRITSRLQSMQHRMTLPSSVTCSISSARTDIQPTTVPVCRVFGRPETLPARDTGSPKTLMFRIPLSFQ